MALPSRSNDHWKSQSDLFPPGPGQENSGKICWHTEGQSIVLGLEKLLKQFWLSFFSPMSTYNKSCDLRWSVFLSQQALGPAQGGYK
jgi:hypothetical protein